jgi:predicted nucleotidyltransferase component of viral defense system
MIAIEQIQKWYPAGVARRKLDVLREYLQYEILRALYRSKHGHRYVFLGGTCLRIAYGTDRFSEDLDFDNRDLTPEDFEETVAAIQRWLERNGYEVTIRFVHKGAYHARITFPGLLYKYDLSPHKEAKLLIKVDTEKQRYAYTPRVHTLDTFGIDNDILVTPPELLCAQKIAAVLGRKRPKGRDFYDLRWLLDHHRPDYGYLSQRLGIHNAEELRARVAAHTQPFDFDRLAQDVSPFLFDPQDVDRIRHFPAFWRTTPL